MKVTVHLTPTQAAKLRAIAASRRTTVETIAREFAPTYLAVLAQAHAAVAPPAPRQHPPAVEPPTPSRAFRFFKGGKP